MYTFHPAIREVPGRLPGHEEIPKTLTIALPPFQVRKRDLDYMKTRKTAAKVRHNPSSKLAI